MVSFEIDFKPHMKSQPSIRYTHSFVISNETGQGGSCVTNCVN
jgi:hypothetical protein